MTNPKSILITGASSGIGAALARCYARPGTSLALGGRDRIRLDRIAEECRRQGAEVTPEAVDVTDSAATKAWVERADGHRPLDLVIANAGVSAGTGGGEESGDQARRILATNVDGVINTALPAIAAMRSRRAGQIAVMSSLAGFRGFPGSPSYSTSKAAVRVLGEAWRGWLAADGIGVCVICPGFVATPMTAVNRFAMPFLVEVDRAARAIQRGLDRNHSRIAFPWPMYAAALLLAALPPSITDPLVRVLPRKG